MFGCGHSYAAGTPSPPPAFSKWCALWPQPPSLPSPTPPPLTHTVSSAARIVSQSVPLANARIPALYRTHRTICPPRWRRDISKPPSSPPLPHTHCRLGGRAVLAGSPLTVAVDAQRGHMGRRVPPRRHARIAVPDTGMCRLPRPCCAGLRVAPITVIQHPPRRRLCHSAALLPIPIRAPCPPPLPPAPAPRCPRGAGEQWRGGGGARRQKSREKGAGPPMAASHICAASSRRLRWSQRRDRACGPAFPRVPHTTALLCPYALVVRSRPGRGPLLVLVHPSPPTP